MHVYDIELRFEKGYIAHPYWPARERLINITKESGTNRARSTANRLRSLNDYLAAHNISEDDYAALERQANRQFYTWSDRLTPPEMDGHNPDEIVIPSHQLHGALAQACALATASLRIAKAEQLRVVLNVEDLGTGKYQPDGAWERFVTVTGGTGAKLSNQRALRSNEYIQKFTATGRLHFLESQEPERVQRFLEFCGRDVGVGASRKMSWGRFMVTGFAGRA